MTHLIVWSMVFFWQGGGIQDTHTAFDTKKACETELGKNSDPAQGIIRRTCWPEQIGGSYTKTIKR